MWYFPPPPSSQAKNRTVCSPASPDAMGHRVNNQLEATCFIPLLMHRGEIAHFQGEKQNKLGVWKYKQRNAGSKWFAWDLYTTAQRWRRSSLEYPAVWFVYRCWHDLIVYRCWLDLIVYRCCGLPARSILIHQTPMDWISIFPRITG